MPGTDTEFELRSSDSPLIERVWTARSARGGEMTSIAAGHWEIIFSRLDAQVQVAVRGPETVPSQAVCPGQGEWLAIRFRAGTYLPGVPAASLLDGRDLELPTRSRRSFYWQGADWELPGYDDAEAFVQRMQQAGLIRLDPLVSAALQGESLPVSVRTLQRRFLAVTGLQLQTYQQIERARYAAGLLRAGKPLLAVALEAGYYDQPHLSRSCSRFLGQTPGEIAAASRPLSFLYKNDPLPSATLLQTPCPEVLTGA